MEYPAVLPGSHLRELIVLANDILLHDGLLDDSKWRRFHSIFWKEMSSCQIAYWRRKATDAGGDCCKACPLRLTVTTLCLDPRQSQRTRRTDQATVIQALVEFVALCEVWQAELER